MHGGYVGFFPWFPELCNGTYWAADRLDPKRPENEEFLELANAQVASRRPSKDEF
jgi:hypothetical protein